MEIPYIGITDFTGGEMAQEMLCLFEKTSRFGVRKLMVGVMMSYKTLNGLPSKWTAAFPPKEQVSEIFLGHPCVFNALHYADYDGIDILPNILRATEFGGPNMHALQLDMIWPDPKVLKSYARQCPDIKIILQVSAKALDVVENNPHELLIRLDDYLGIIDYVLIDRSMGRGVAMDAGILRSYVAAISRDKPDLGIAVAGGLGPTTLDLVKPLVNEFSNISIDAQGKLRPSGNALNPIDWEMAREYLVKAIEMFESSR